MITSKTFKGLQSRRAFLSNGTLLAVFQGHSHKNDVQEIAAIHYGTLVAMIEGAGPENNGYSTLDILDGGTLRVTGFRKQATYHWKSRS